jgi:hypothetical protein
LCSIEAELAVVGVLNGAGGMDVPTIGSESMSNLNRQ